MWPAWEARRLHSAEELGIPLVISSLLLRTRLDLVVNGTRWLGMFRILSNLKFCSFLFIVKYISTSFGKKLVFVQMHNVVQKKLSFLLKCDCFAPTPPYPSLGVLLLCRKLLFTVEINNSVVSCDNNKNLPYAVGLFRAPEKLENNYLALNKTNNQCKAENFAYNLNPNILYTQ